jgi:ribosome-associated protein
MNTEDQKNVRGDPEPGQQRIPEQQRPRGQQRLPGRQRLPGLPARDAPVAIDDQAALALARRIVEVAADKKASDVVLLQISALTTVADYFVICSGGSERQLGAIADGITEALREDGQRPIGREGNAATHWVLLDYGAVIVHVFAPPEREFYQLERLWAEAPALLRIQ